MKKLLGTALLAVASLAHADDQRIRTDVYDKGEVYAIHTKVGRATLIQFEDDESLTISPSSVLGIGDADAWNIGVRGNNLVVKPTQKLPETNVIVVTNKRTYSLDLLDTPKGAKPTYIQRFRYLDSEAAKAAADAKKAQITAAAKAEKVVVNTDYVWRGENDMLKPTAAYDDGRFTRLVYDHGGALPVFSRVLPDGTEAMLDYNIDPENRNTVVVHEVVKVARARMGDSVIEIINKGYVLPKFNQAGTSVPGAVRVEKGNQQ